jgi:hypothetical protein
MPDRKSTQTPATDRNISLKDRVREPAAAAPVSEAEARLKAEQDDLLTEALEESFPASDPVSSLRFTQQKPKGR